MSRTTTAYLQRPLLDVAGDPLRLFSVGSNWTRTGWHKDPVSGLWVPGALLEPYAINAGLQSERFDLWASTTGLSFDAAAGTALDGATTLNKLTETATTGWHRCQGTPAVESTGARLVCRVWVQDGTRGRVFVSVSNVSVGNHAYAIVDLATGLIDEATSSGAAITFDDAFVEAVPGWSNMYRITVVGTVVYNGQNYTHQIALTDSASGVPSSYLGDVGKYLYAWGNMYHVDQPLMSTSYIKTTTGPVQRTGDSEVRWGTVVPDEFTALLLLTMPHKHLPPSATSQLWIDDGTSSNRITVEFTTAGKVRAYCTVGGGTEADVTVDKVIFGSDGPREHRVALAYRRGRISLSVDGVEDEDSGAHVPGMDAIALQPAGSLASLQWRNEWLTGQPVPPQPDVLAA